MDLFLFHQINQYAGRWPLLDNISIFCAKYLEYFLLFFLFVFLLERASKNWKVVLKALVSAIIARFLFVNFIRFLWQRPRPFVENSVNLLLNYSNEPSFPSGHAAFYFALSTVVFFYNKDAGALSFFLTLLICLARIFVGIHWPSDILAGAVIGIFSGWLVDKIFRKLKK